MTTEATCDHCGHDWVEHKRRALGCMHGWDIRNGVTEKGCRCPKVPDEG